MAYPDILYTICCVAEIEHPEQTCACDNCGGTQLKSDIYYEADGSGFEAQAFLSGGNLQSYRFDNNAPTYIAEYPPDLKVFISYPEAGFQHLCLKYNREGGARINVVAVDEKGHKIRPSTSMADGSEKILNGTDWTCPIASASIEEEPFGVEQFLWDDGQMTVLLEKDRGAWTIEPFVLGNMMLTAKPQLEPENPVFLSPDVMPGKFQFVSWERNKLSNWVVGEDHQWFGKKNEDTIEFDNNTYIGVIAHYKHISGVAGDPHIEWPTTKPGRETPGYPEPRVQSPFVYALLQVWSRIVVFVQGLFRR